MQKGRGGIRLGAKYLRATPLPSGRNLTKPVRASNEVDGRALLGVGWQKDLTERGSKNIHTASEMKSFEDM